MRLPAPSRRRSGTRQSLRFLLDVTLGPRVLMACQDMVQADCPTPLDRWLHFINNGAERFAEYALQGSAGSWARPRWTFVAVREARRRRRTRSSARWRSRRLRGRPSARRAAGRVPGPQARRPRTSGIRDRRHRLGRRAGRQPRRRRRSSNFLQSSSSRSRNVSAASSNGATRPTISGVRSSRSMAKRPSSSTMVSRPDRRWKRPCSRFASIIRRESSWLRRWGPSRAVSGCAPLLTRSSACRRPSHSTPSDSGIRYSTRRATTKSWSFFVRRTRARNQAPQSHRHPATRRRDRTTLRRTTSAGFVVARK